ncbi:MAG: hypothetical protein AAGJ18_00845, partial [Bacteroidota bacterium]
MKYLPQHIERIEAYLYQKMNPVERKVFEQDLKADDALAHTFQVLSVEFEVTKLLVKQEYKKIIKEVAKENDAEQRAAYNKMVKQSARRRWIIQWSVAASLLLLIGGQFLASHYYSNQALTKIHLKDSLEKTRGIQLSPNVSNILQPVYEKMNVQQYDQAIAVLKTLSSEQYRAKILLLLGENQFLLEEYTLAA